MKILSKVEGSSLKKDSLKLIVFSFAIVVYALFAYAFGNESICIFKVYAGLPCPGCGMTRAFMSLFHGHIHAAFFWHPLWPVVLLGPIFYWQLGRKGKNKKHQNYLIWGIFILFISVYICRLVLYFPNHAPMDYNPQAIFPRIYELFLIH